MAILKIRDENGNIVEIPVLRGPRGEKGDDGDRGQKGDTPVKGTDYWTATDKEEIVSAVMAALPTAEGASF